ncbi:unnamed protein product [Rotaria sordida]|uniref:Uncharacterized protein n=1 Tax=Rotaria sordida TaxID=392033 RepID=A0A815RQN4_9BILA|nr:unnamed protein product [Rotaria sordida]CAF0919010.1 unnamed protein product [Rotaria sordida]CAF1481007.1 unnamed protein product [Rotaria sordida]CAF3719759.1 unnamed protein product [Rotaria sordida]CAF4034848.1 unnamed protein product [Rotaria sordida]
MFSIGMRRFQIEEHPTSLDQKFTLMDEDDNCLYTVKSTFFVLGDKLTVMDSHGTELYKIRQQLKHIHLTFNIYNAGINDDNEESKLATVKQVGFPLKHTLEIHSVYGDYLMKRDGGMTCSEYTLSKDGVPIAQVKRKFPAFAERYTVDIDEQIHESDIPFILTLVITLWCAQRYRGQGSGS